MTSTLIVIGHDAQYPLHLDEAEITRACGGLQANCSPNCGQTQSLVTGRGLLQGNFGQTVLAFCDDPQIKPAELYVIQFDQTKTALDFVNQEPKFLNTRHRSLLLVENTPAADPAKAAANPYILVIIGKDPSNLLHLDTSGTCVIAQCSNCVETALVVYGNTAKASAGWTLSQAVADKPAETYVLGFPSAEEALAFVRAVPAAAEVQRRTVLLVRPRATP